MVRSLPALLAVLGFAGLALAVTGPRAMGGDGPVYPIAAMQDNLTYDPGAWVGRTVVLRAIALPCPWWGATARLQRCGGRPLVLVATPTDAPNAPLPLVRPAPQPLLSFLSGLPVFGDLLPRSPAVPVGAPARFRVRLVALPAGACAGHLPCYEALWLDATPDSPRGARR
jgi:hypothetical protein